MPTRKSTSTSSSFDPPNSFRQDKSASGKGDSRSGKVYVFNDRLRLAVRVALATGRPLLVRGESGWGKSSLAAASARWLNRSLFESVITSRTLARDLQWDVDLLLRLNDAQAQKLNPDFRSYVRPGVLWWAFDPNSAFEQRKLYDAARGVQTEEQPPAATVGAVVLIDEIDKADPDLPNNLLVTLGSLEFRVDETGQVVKADETRTPLIFITTNEERELPAAFLRRCIEIRLPALPDEDRDGNLRKHLLVEIVLAHGIMQGTQVLSRKYIERVADILMPTPKTGESATVPSPAEFKDTILALIDRSGTDAFPEKDLREIAQMTITKWRAAHG